MTAEEWIASEIIGNEVHGFGPLPLKARDQIARAMRDLPEMGWPTLEDAHATLDDWSWIS